MSRTIWHFRFLSLLYLLLSSLHVQAQQHEISGKVVDADTGDPLPYVTIYLGPGRGTLSNEDGDFSIDAKDDDVLKISCVGYKQMSTKASEMPMVLKMKPFTKELQELTVVAVPVRDVLSQTIKQLKKDIKTGKSRERMYFQRTVISDSTNTELVEMFVKAGSGINLHDMRVISGIKGQDGIGGESELSMRKTNMQSLMEIGPLTIASGRWEKAIKPLVSLSDTKKYYDYSACTLHGDNGERICKIEFTLKDDLPRSKENVHVLVGSAYIDADSYELLRFDGEVKNMYQRVLHNNMFQRAPMTLKVHVEYDHSRGTIEVSHLSIQGGNGRMHFRSLAFNVENRKVAGEKGVAIGQNLMDAIEDAGHESPLWDDYNIVQRSADEEMVAFGFSSGYSAKKAVTTFEPDTAATSNPKLHDLFCHLMKFGNQVPQEKVYIHMDNTSYFQGDTIWFSAYTRSTDSGRPSTVSGLLYVELLNSDGFLMNRQIIRMRNGHGYGNFVLNKQLMYSGFYELRAYTRWQLNFGCNEHWHSSVSKEWFLSKEMERRYYRDYDKLYSRVFPVYDRMQDSIQYNRNMTTRTLRRYFRKEQEKTELGITFYPEGGNLVEGLPCKVAFEATWSDGEWADGILTIGKDTVPTQNRGRGVFLYIPESGEEPSAVFHTTNGKTIKANLPKAEKHGISLQVGKKDSMLCINTFASEDLSGEPLGLTVMHEGCLEVFRPINGQDSIRISSSSLRSSGVHQVTVFNSEGHVLADRLVFIVKKGTDKPTLTVNCSNREYSPNEKIELDISAPSLKEGSGKGYTSIAVRDGNYSDYLFDNGSIFTEMLLSSEIKGFVPNPGWFFEKDDEEHRQALDLLMMTQGWRKFNWYDMAVEGAWKEVQPKEKKSMILNGTVYSAEWMQDSDYRLQEQQYLDNLLGDADNTSSNDWEEDENDEKEEKYDTELRSFSREEITETVSDDSYDKRSYKADLNKEVYIGTELLNLETSYRNSKKDILKTTRNRFEMVLPYFTSPHVMYMDVWSNKDELRRRNDKVKLDKVVLAEDKEYQICIDFPYPRFVKPYSFYQTHLREITEQESFQSRTLDDSTIVLREVPVRSRFGGLRQHDDSQPVLILGDLEVENLMTDAGIIAPGPDRLGRTLFGDMGVDFPFVRKPTIDLPDFGQKSSFRETQKGQSSGIRSRDSRIRVRYGIGPTRRNMENLSDIPKDSIYSPKYLKSYPPSILKSMSRGEKKEYAGVGAIEKYVIYTDYSPRMEGSKRYQGANLPEIFIAKYPYSDGSRNIIFADRCIVLPGFAQPDEFYHPDYSRHKLPEGEKDYRRTLYWNPNLQLDEKGEARISFYNNSRTTRIVVDAEGQAADGTLLWYK